MREADRGLDKDAGKEAAIRRALVDMMLQSTWQAFENKDFEFALEYPIAVLSLENNSAAAFALGAAALAFLIEVLPGGGLEPLLTTYLASAGDIEAAPFDDLEELVPKQDQLQLLAFASAYAAAPNAALEGLEDCATKLVRRFEVILDRIRSRSPSGEIISGHLQHAPDATVSTSRYSLTGSDEFQYDFPTQDIFISYATQSSYPAEYRIENLASHSVYLEPDPEFDPDSRKALQSQQLHLNRAQMRLLLVRARLRVVRASRSFVLSYRRGRRR